MSSKRPWSRKRRMIFGVQIVDLVVAFCLLVLSLTTDIQSYPFFVFLILSILVNVACILGLIWLDA